MNYKRRLFGWGLVAVMVPLLASCGDFDAPDAGGSLVADIRLPLGTSPQAFTRGYSSTLTGTGLISHYVATVSAPDLAPVSVVIPAGQTEGVIEKVLPGSNRILSVTAVTTAGVTLLQGAVGGLSIYTGQTTQAGTVTLDAVVNSGLSNPSGFSTSPSTGQIALSWTAPAAQEYLLVLRATGHFPASPAA